MKNENMDFEFLCIQHLDSLNKNYKTFFRSINNLVMLVTFQLLLDVLFLILVLVRMFKSGKQVPKIFVHSLAKSQIYQNKSTSDLFNFLSEKRFSYSSEQSDYLVYCKSLILSRTSTLKVTRNISLYLIMNCFKWTQIVELFKITNGVVIFIIKNKKFFNSKLTQICYLLLEYCAWSLLTSESKIVVITTQSSHKKLPVPFYMGSPNFERHMIWYSSNSIPIRKKSEEKPTLVLSPNLANFVDSHLVWDKMQIDFLESQKISNSKAYGSMLFYPRKVNKHLTNSIDVLYFDVVPQNLYEDSFYSTKMSLNNLECIIEVITEYNNQFDSNLVLSIKHKRKASKAHSRTYLNRVEYLTRLGMLRIISPSENLYDLVNRSKLVIGTPFTSPVIIAKEFDIDCVFVCFNALDYSIPNIFNEVLVVKEKRMLLDSLTKLI